MDADSERLYAITPDAEAREFAGGVRVRVVRAGWFRPDAGGFFGVVPKPLWSRLVEADERGRVLCRLNLLLVESGGKRLLVETGTGERMRDKDREIKGIEGGSPAAFFHGIRPVVIEHLFGGFDGAEESSDTAMMLGCPLQALG